MIIKLKENGSLKIVKDTIENTKAISIRVEHYRNYNFSEKYLIFINGEILEKKNDKYSLNHSKIKYGENLIEVLWIDSNGKSKKYSLITNMQNYFSLGDHRIEEHPQVIVDLLEKINKLEKRIKSLEEKGTIIWMM